MAGQCQRNRSFVVVQRIEAGRIGHRPTKCQRAGLVDQRVIDFGHAFERRAVLDQNPPPHQRARRNHLRHRHGKPQRARTRDDQHRNRDHERVIDARSRQHPADEGQRRQRMHRRGIEPRSTVGDPHIMRPHLPRRFHQPRNLGQRGILARRRHPHIDRVFQIERSCQYQAVDSARHRRAFAGQQGLVEPAGAAHDGAVGRQPFAGSHTHHHAGNQVCRSGPVRCAIVIDNERPARRLTQQRVDTRAGAITHHRIERTPGQQEQQQHQRAVEPRLLAAGHRLIE